MPPCTYSITSFLLYHLPLCHLALTLSPSTMPPCSNSYHLPLCQLALTLSPRSYSFTFHYATLHLLYHLVLTLSPSTMPPCTYSITFHYATLHLLYHLPLCHLALTLSPSTMPPCTYSINQNVNTTSGRRCFFFLILINKNCGSW